MHAFIVSFLIGIIFENFFHFGFAFVAFIFFIFSVLFFYSRFSKIFLAVGLGLALGILRISFVDTLPDQNLYKLVGQKVSFEATISDEPDVRETSTRYTVLPDETNSFILLVAERYPELKYGNKIKVSGKLDLPKNFIGNNGEEFDYISYLSKDKIHFVVYRPEIEFLGGGKGSRFVGFLYSLKNIFIQKISDVVPEPDSSLLAGMIFGSKQSLGENLLADFKKVGLIHIVVLSGYNITIVAAGIFSLVSYFGRRNLSFLVSAISIIIFSAMVGFGATVIRAAIMALIAILARFLGRPSDALRWLFIAAFLMLLWNPLSLSGDPSFQLSFMATLGLVVFTPVVQEKFFDPMIRFLAKIKIPASVISFLSNKFGIREIVSSTLAVQFFILPLLIKMSGQFSVISFLINPIVLPFVPLMMALGGITGGLGVIPFLGKFLSWPFGAIAYAITQAVIYIVEFSSRIPLSSVSTGSLSIFAVFIWYAVYIFLYFKLKCKDFNS